MPERIPSIVQRLKLITWLVVVALALAFASIALGAWGLSVAVHAGDAALAREQAARKDEIRRVQGETDAEFARAVAVAKAASAARVARLCAAVAHIPDVLAQSIRENFCDAPAGPGPAASPSPSPGPTVFVPEPVPVPGPTRTVIVTVPPPAVPPSRRPTPPPPPSSRPAPRPSPCVLRGLSGRCVIP